MDTWKQLIFEANQAFQAGDWQDAEHQYLVAVSRINHLYAEYANDEQVMMAWLASYHNLSELYGRQGKADAQLSNIMIPYHQLRNRLITQADNKPIYAAILHGLKLSCKELYLFQKSQLQGSKCVDMNALAPVIH
ncbi:hypothetical protein MK852_14760 [Shewanella benthica]|uniref:hypothetical protein n=1 Tax=Shewanella TaxID=22 RepID=UPI00187903F5|nr:MULTISPECIES: hypothetical protein [Shewanella]MBE7215776.1 hypothetical protein [Shewanella benthica]MBL4813907.1 hypothetical protein [Shewanella sp.]MCJ8303741.1 hypothetical protein [Shewanella sp.]MCL1063371.1 hypothetical protein [Shewanella benthica]